MAVRICPRCGNIMNAETGKCKSCRYTDLKVVQKEDKVSIGIVIMCIFSFLSPIVGIIAYFINKGKGNIQARLYLNIAKVSILLNLAMGFFSMMDARL